MAYKLKLVALSLTLAAGVVIGAGIRNTTIPPPAPPDPARYIDLQSLDAGGIAVACSHWPYGKQTIPDVCIRAAPYAALQRIPMNGGTAR